MNRPRASACRNAPPAAWKSRSAGGRCRNDRASAPSRYGQRWRRAERPPLWGSDDVSAMRNYRYRHRDSPYVAMRSGERTSRAGRPWAVGGELPGARWRGRPVCARGGRPCGGSGGTNARVSVFFIHIHPRLRRRAPAGRKGGPISSASGSFSSLCWSWGVGARGVGAVGLHARGGARGTGRAGQRGGVRRG